MPAEIKFGQKAFQSVFITGASTGIGRAAALELNRRGYRVLAGVRREIDSQQLREISDGRIQPVLLDICDPAQLKAAVEHVQGECLNVSGLYALINNAGVCEPGPLECIDLHRFRRQFDVNLFGHLAVIQAFLPIIRKQPGRIINVASSLGRFAMPMMGAYVASKFAMIGFSDTLRRELRWWKIPVSTIEAGTVDTPLWDKTTTVPPRRGDGRLEDELGLYQEFGPSVNRVMQQGRKNAASPEVVARTISRAVAARHPRARYFCAPGSLMAVIGSLVPDAITDWILDGVIRQKLPTRLLGF